MTSVPEVLAAEVPRQEPATAGRERISADIPGDVRRRLRVWAALLGRPDAHVVTELIVAAVPDDEQLADLMRAGGRHDNQH